METASTESSRATSLEIQDTTHHYVRNAAVEYLAADPVYIQGIVNGDEGQHTVESYLRLHSQLGSWADEVVISAITQFLGE